MKILFIHSGTDLYGASRSLFRLASRLVKDGHSVSVVLPGAGLLNSELAALGIKVWVMPDLVTITRSQVNRGSGFFRLGYLAIASTVQLIRLIQREQPDLVHSMTAVLPSSGLAARLLGKPHLWHMRESFSEFPSLWRVYQWYIAALSNKILCVSTPVADQFSPTLRRKTVVLHNGFPQAEFTPVDDDRVARVRAEWGLTPGSLAVGVVGRIKFRRKGQEVFLKAAAHLREKYPQVRFLCIGSPFPGNEDHLARLLELAKKLDLGAAFLYTGDAADIKAALSALDVLVLPSVQPEPFGGVVIEAMAFKKPVVATAIGGSLEQVADGRSGYLVTPGDPQQLANAIEKLIVDPGLRQAMGQNGFQRYLECFEFEPFYQKLTAIYRSTLKPTSYE